MYLKRLCVPGYSWPNLDNVLTSFHDVSALDDDPKDRLLELLLWDLANNTAEVTLAGVMFDSLPAYTKL